MFQNMVKYFIFFFFKNNLFVCRHPWPCEWMSNFHFSMMVGCFCFAIFWLVLLLRIYLPDKYWINKDHEEEEEGEGGQEGPLSILASLEDALL